MKNPLCVRLSLLLIAAGGCARPTQEHPAGAAGGPGRSRPPEIAIAATAAAPSPGPSSSAPTPAAISPGLSPAGSSSTAVTLGSSAYVGCGQAIPAARLWDETTEAEVLDAIASAKSCAAQHGRRLLLEFVAPWCADCQEMAKLDATPIVTAALQRRFERVRINVGKWDRHEALRNNFDVHALATYIVIDPKTSKQLAKTTLEPITRKAQKLSAEEWAEWLDAH